MKVCFIWQEAIQPADYSGDSRLISNNGAVAIAMWQFNGLQKGAAYRILASWTASSSAATDLVFRLTDFYHDGVVGFWPVDVTLLGPNQRQATSDLLRFENGVFNGWKELHAGFTISSAPNSPGSLVVHFASSQAIHADAIRIERLASTMFEYDANGNLLTETDPLGRVTTYAYDELDRVVTEMLPDPDAAEALISPLTTTKYDGYGNVASVLERRGNGSHQRTTKYAYDSRNRRTEEIFDFGVATTNLNRKTVFDYDDVGNLEHRFEYAPNVATPSTFDLLRTTSYKYDKLDRQTSETLNSDGIDNNAAPSERITATAYDANGNVFQTVENANTSAQLITQYLRDSLGRVAVETAVDLPLSPSSVRITRFQYDAAGQQIATIDPLLRVSRSDFDRLGRLVKSTDPDPGVGDPHVTTFVYDAAGQLLLKNNGDNATPGAHEIDRYAYDPQGRLIRSEDGLGDVTRRVYDDAGNLVKLIDPAGNITTYEYDGLDRQITETIAAGERKFLYDNNGNLQYSVDRNGQAILYAYTRDDQKSGSWEYSSLVQAQIPGSQSFIAFTQNYYDALGRLEEERYTRRNDYSQTSGVEYRATDSYKYDGLDRLIEHSNQSLRDPVNSNSTGVPALKQTYVYAYDSNGEIVTREQFIANQFAASTKSTYNAFGELIRQEDKETTAGGVPSSILDFESTDAAFAYLADGSLESTTRYTDWDATLAGHRNRVKTTYGYDDAGRIKNIAHTQNRRTTATWPGVDTNLVSFAYGYDAANRINSINTDWNQSHIAFSTRTDESQAFAYDGAGQLTGVTIGSGGTKSYVYGPNGNRTSANDWGATAVYSPGTQNRVAQDAVYSYVYDAEGNLTERKWISGNQLNLRYTWDQRNRLTKLEQYDSLGTLTNTIQYRYDASDNLIYKSATPAGQPSQVEHYLVESGQRTLTFETDGDVKHRIQYGPTGDVLFDQIFNAAGSPTLQAEQELQILLGDHQHSVRVVVAHDANDAAYVQQSLNYTPFGQLAGIVYEDGSEPIDYPYIAASFGFQGMLYDGASGQYRTQTRIYDARLGRFISEDPIQDGSNWYAFAGNDPVNFADPSGLSQQGHPLGGGFSGNVTIGSGHIPANSLFGGPALSPGLNNFIQGAVKQSLNPVRIPSTTFGGFVDAGAGSSILANGLSGGARIPSVGSIAQYQAAAPRMTAKPALAAPRSQPAAQTGFFEGLVNQATPYLPWRTMPVASTVGKFALDMNARNADGLVAGARATRDHVSDVYASASSWNLGEAATKHLAFSLGNASQSMIAHLPTNQHFAQYYGPVAHWLDTESATRGETAAPFTEFVATSAISGGAGQVVRNVGRLRVGLNANVLKSPQLNSGGGFNAIEVYMAPKKSAASYEALVNEAKLRYPNKAGKPELHHVDPVYLGGARSGVRVELDAAYHQQITNEFRLQHPYGQQKPSPVRLQQIKDIVYSKYPLPPG